MLLDRGMAAAVGLRTPHIPTKSFRGFTHSLRANAGIVFRLVHNNFQIFSNPSLGNHLMMRRYVQSELLVPLLHRAKGGQYISEVNVL